MKNFLKRANRGLILGTVILVGFIAFIITDTARFKKAKPQIEADVKAYIDALADLAVTPDSKEEFQKKSNELINSYWVSDSGSGNTNNYYEMNIGSYRNQMEMIADESFSDKSDSGRVTGWNANPFDFNITKAGSKFANVNFTCGITADFVGDPYLISPESILHISDYVYYGDTADENPFKTNTPKKLSVTAEYDALLKEVSGKWKIVRIASWGWHSAEITTPEDTEGGTQ